MCAKNQKKNTEEDEKVKATNKREKILTNNKKGISLISLVITIIVIIILAAIVIFTGLGTPDKANFAKFTSEFADFNLAVQNDYMNRYAKYATENKVRSKEQIYYEIASGKDASEMESEEKLLVADLGSEISNGLRGTYYFEITDDRNVTGWKEDKTYYQSDETERHFVTDEGEVFITPGYGIEENGATKWYINESKFYGGEPQGGEGGGDTPPEEVALEPGAKATVTEKDNYEDTNGAKATIPAGFTISAVAGESTIADGLVIKDDSGNEFVWIPVSDTDYANMIGEETKTMSDGVTTTDYYGKGSSLTGTLNGTSSSGYREPDILGTSYDSDANAQKAGFTDRAAMVGGLRDSFKAMTESVKKYKGFYIARYELGEGNVSKAGVRPQVSNTTTTNANYIGAGNWYNLYKNCGNLSLSSGAKSSVVSSMIWGCQWDAMVSFIGNPSPSGLSTTLGLTGSYGDGGTAVKNVCDTRTSVYDYTATANGTNSRARRGGSCISSISAGYVGYGYPTGTSYFNSSGARAQLYIK